MKKLVALTLAVITAFTMLGTATADDNPDPGPPPDSKGRVPPECAADCDDDRCCYLRCACAKGLDAAYRDWACRKYQFFKCDSST